jgi:hypothetical protein
MNLVREETEELESGMLETGRGDGANRKGDVWKREEQLLDA